LTLGLPPGYRSGQKNSGGVDVRDLIGLAVAGFLLLGAAAPTMAEDNPALDDVKTLCIANHAKADKVLSLADAQGWAKPPGAPGDGLRTKTVGADDRTVIAISKSETGGESPGSGMVEADLCVVTTKVAGPDIKAAARAYVGGQAPIAEEDGSWIWIFTQGGEPRRFLADKEKATLLAALKDGPVAVFAAAGGPDGDKMAYAELRLAAK
jgi:hypothetical protein